MENKDQNKLPAIPQWVCWVFAALIILFAIKVTEVMVPFIISAVLACFLNVFAEFFEKKGMRRSHAVTLSITACSVLIIMSFFFIIPPLIGQAYQLHKTASYAITEIHKAGIKKQQTKIGALEKQAGDIKDTISAYIAGLYETYPEVKSIIGEELEIRELLKTKQQEIANSIFSFINETINNAAGFFSHVLYIVLMPIFTCYFLIIIPDLRKRFEYVMSKNMYGAQIKDIISRIIDMINHYIRGMSIVMVMYGTAVGVSCWVMSLFSGAKYSLIIGFASGILCVIPYVGQAAIYIMAASIIYCTSGSVMASAISVPVIFAVNFISDNYVSPKIVGNQTGLHPLIAMFAMLSAGKVFGFWGMVLGVPMAGAVKIIMMQLYPVLFENMDPKEKKQNDERIARAKIKAPTRGFENPKEKKQNDGKQEKSSQAETINKKKKKFRDPEEDREPSSIRIPAGDDSESPFTLRETRSEKRGPEIMKLKTFKAITKSLLPPKHKEDKKQDNKISAGWSEAQTENRAPEEHSKTLASRAEKTNIREEQQDTNINLSLAGPQKKKKSKNKTANGDRHKNKPETAAEAKNDITESEDNGRKAKNKNRPETAAEAKNDITESEDNGRKAKNKNRPETAAEAKNNITESEDNGRKAKNKNRPEIAAEAKNDITESEDNGNGDGNKKQKETDKVKDLIKSDKQIGQDILQETQNSANNRKKKRHRRKSGKASMKGSTSKEPETVIQETEPDSSKQNPAPQKAENKAVKKRRNSKRKHVQIRPEEAKTNKTEPSA
ncbi:MAG: AI-2E family transporter [bacterium]|nr:AI-2E family transporter [bacterium]